MSSSGAHQLQKITTSQSQTELEVIPSFEALAAWSLQTAELALFHPRPSSHDHLMIFEYEGHILFLIGSQLFLDPVKLQAALTGQTLGKTAIFLLAGTPNELSLARSIHDSIDFESVILPSTTHAASQFIQTVFRYNAVINQSKSEHQLLQETTENVKYVMSISRELNGERDIPKLLNLILLKAREITKADAGSIYTVEWVQNSKKLEDAKLRFRLTQNASIKTDFNEFTIPIDTKSIVGNAVLNHAPINIPDLYKLSDNPAENPFGVKHNRTFDQRIGYQSHSMLTFPMYDISHRVIGVIQLINRKRDFSKNLATQSDFDQQVVPFSEHDEEYAQIVAQQAGIALENAEMHNEIRHLFHGFVNASVTAIEQRDPTTSGHSHRVALLTTELAKAVDRSDLPQFASLKFSEDELREIEYASLLHDFGKLGVRENVLVKAKKLYPWQHENIIDRFELIRAAIEIEYLRKLVNYMTNPMAFPMDFNADTLKLDRDAKMADIEDYIKFIASSNEPTVLPQGGFERLADIAKFEFSDLSGNKKNFLKADELKALSVSRGSLTAEEFAEIQSHVVHTYEFLRKIPWGHRLANVPEIAAKHHEKLDGTGYPTSASGTQIPIQSRMMTISDIYDALTASDRPYKKAVPAEKALDIINMEVKGGKIDVHLFEIFVASGAFKVVFEKKP
jgi:HD-GYP domain-containing protein (c-di-GMP phosphodiesterase class II)